MVIPIFLICGEHLAASSVLHFNGDDAAGAGSSNSAEPTVAPAEGGTRGAIVVAEPNIPIGDPHLELGATIELQPGTEEMRDISLLTKRFHRLHTQFGSYNIYSLQEPYFWDNLDDSLLEAQRRGPIDFRMCFDQAQVDLDCLEREGRLHQKLYSLISSESSFPTFFYNTPRNLKDSIATSCYDTRFRPYLSLEEKLALRQDLSQLLYSLQQQGRGALVYVEASHLAKTGDLPPPRGA